MEKMLAKSGGGGSGTTQQPKNKKLKTPKTKKSVLQLSKELIPDGIFAGFLDILEPHERR